MEPNQILIVGLISLAVSLVGLCSLLVHKLIKKQSSLSETEKLWLRDLHDWHNIDNPKIPGSKIWYARDSEDIHAEIVDLLEKVDLSQKLIANQMKIFIEIIEKLLIKV